MNLAFKGEIKKDNAPLRVKEPARISNGNANALPSAQYKGGGMYRQSDANKDGNINKAVGNLNSEANKVRPRSNYGSAA